MYQVKYISANQSHTLEAMINEFLATPIGGNTNYPIYPSEVRITTITSTAVLITYREVN